MAFEKLLHMKDPNSPEQVFSFMQRNKGVRQLLPMFYHAFQECPIDARTPFFIVIDYIVHSLSSPYRLEILDKLEELVFSTLKPSLSRTTYKAIYDYLQKWKRKLPRKLHESLISRCSVIPSDGPVPLPPVPRRPTLVILPPPDMKKLLLTVDRIGNLNSDPVSQEMVTLLKLKIQNGQNAQLLVQALGERLAMRNKRKCTGICPVFNKLRFVEPSQFANLRYSFRATLTDDEKTCSAGEFRVTLRHPGVNQMLTELYPDPAPKRCPECRVPYVLDLKEKKAQKDHADEHFQEKTRVARRVARNEKLSRDWFLTTEEWGNNEVSLNPFVSMDESVWEKKIQVRKNFWVTSEAQICVICREKLTPIRNPNPPTEYSLSQWDLGPEEDDSFGVLATLVPERLGLVCNDKCYESTLLKHTEQPLVPKAVPSKPEASLLHFPKEVSASHEEIVAMLLNNKK